MYKILKQFKPERIGKYVDPEKFKATLLKERELNSKIDNEQVTETTETVESENTNSQIETDA